MSYGSHDATDCPSFSHQPAALSTLFSLFFPSRFPYHTFLSPLSTPPLFLLYTESKKKKNRKKPRAMTTISRPITTRPNDTNLNDCPPFYAHQPPDPPLHPTRRTGQPTKAAHVNSSPHAHGQREGGGTPAVSPTRGGIGQPSTQK